jgi:hypothetical protein
MSKPFKIGMGSLTVANERAQIRGTGSRDEKEEKERFFAALETFANMGDSLGARPRIPFEQC